jgi:hypothetical protein
MAVPFSLQPDCVQAELRQNIDCYRVLFSNLAHQRRLHHSLGMCQIFATTHYDVRKSQTLRLGPDGLIYITCENSAVVAVINRTTHTVIDVIDPMLSRFWLPACYLCPKGQYRSTRSG